jgi:hypothetical protein
MALNAAEEQAASERAAAVRTALGHPVERWEALRDRIQDGAIKQFSEVADEWLDLMWCLDAYRREQAPPSGMGKPGASWRARLEGAYRGKGNWFATLLSLLLDNRTGETLRSRGRIAGFSQNHQIDLAWPDRKVAPVVCAESKVTGAPPFGDTRARGAMDDWSNRRKELKFAATDLKLARRKQTEDIGHWDEWRTNAYPKCFMLWAARMTPADHITSMVTEAEAVVATYLDGAGIIAWQENLSGDGYELVKLPDAKLGLQVVELDNALWMIESVIKRSKRDGLDEVPVDATPAVDPDVLAPDPD